MAYTYGLVGLASIVSGTGQLLSADTSALNTAIRVFDFCLVLTSATVDLYAGTNTAGGALLHIDKANPSMNSNAGLRFVGGVYQIASATTGNLATISYIKEF